MNNTFRKNVHVNFYDIQTLILLRPFLTPTYNVLSMNPSSSHLALISQSLNPLFCGFLGPPYVVVLKSVLVGQYG